MDLAENGGMPTLLFLGAVLLSPVDPGHGVISPLRPEEIGPALTFEAFRPNQVALGYSLRKAEMLNLGTANGGRKQVLRLHYTNPNTWNSFDLVQMPVTPGLSTRDAIHEVMKLKVMDVPNDPSMTIVLRRRGHTEIGFYGSMLSVPSAEKLIDEMVAIRR